MFNELKYIYLIVSNAYNESYVRQENEQEISEEILFNVAYLIFFFGIGPNSSKNVRDLLGEKYTNFFTHVEQQLKLKQRLWRLRIKANRPIEVAHGDEIFELKIKYLPCNGHTSKLSHYVRNLFQIVRYIDEQNESVFSYEMKFQYAGTLRSQLSTHEQLLIYYNALSVLGHPWIKQGLLEKYCIIRSTPLPLADFYKTPLSWLPEINSYDKTLFEWTEIKKRFNP